MLKFVFVSTAPAGMVRESAPSGEVSVPPLGPMVAWAAGPVGWPWSRFTCWGEVVGELVVFLQLEKMRMMSNRETIRRFMVFNFECKSGVKEGGGQSHEGGFEGGMKEGA